ncbi:CDP-glycerol glycerophosphotransferase family protein [Leucobacter sp. GX24907]
MSTGDSTTENGRLRKLLSLLAYLLSFLCSLFVPRRADRWVFGSWIGVGEGALAVARELRTSDPQARIVWTIGEESEAARAEAEGFIPVLRSSWAGFRETLTARHIVITHSFGDVNRFGVAGASVTHLGHGAPIKRLHHHIAAMTDGPGFARSVMRRLYRVWAARVGLYVAGSVTVAERLRSANRVDPGRVRVLGDPRDDEVIAQARDAARAAAARAEVRRLLELPHEASTGVGSPEILVFYAPTWRDGEADPAVPTPDEAAAISARLAELGARLVIRSHPRGRGAYAEVFAGHERVHSLHSGLAADITPLLGAFDVLISDYSSIAIDYALLGRPILWFAPDLRHYSSTRGLYEPLEVTAAGRILDTWESTLSRLGAVLSPAGAREAEAEARALAARFHAYPEGGAAARVLAEIRRLDLPADQRVAEGIFFESFEGREANCNPLAIDREIAARFPSLPRYWSVTSERVVVPEGAIPLLVGGSDWFAARRRARLLVVNDWLRYGFSRRRGQTVLQTWHGTMLKHLALTRPSPGLQTRIAVRRESRRWSLLLSQNPHSTAQFRRSYVYSGEVIETGYPRDDRLARSTVESPNGPERISFLMQSARRELGVPDGARVLVYAPTWRERTRGQAAGLVDLLDVRALAAELDTEADPWVVLVRGHIRTLHFGGYGGLDSRVIDVSRHPDVNDVFLAADLLVTDYSSVMFDAAVAAVPMAFFVPDLADYRDRERGFTFDFEESAPGPLISSRDELIATARRGVAYSESYAAWRERFVPHDDGHAAERVVDELVRRGSLG